MGDEFCGASATPPPAIGYAVVAGRPAVSYV